MIDKKQLQKIKKDFQNDIKYEYEREHLAKERGCTLKTLFDCPYDYELNDEYENFAFELGYLQALNDLLEKMEK